MITQMSPLFQVMSLPVSTRAANETAARASMNTPRLTPTSTAKAAKRDAKPAYLPCRLSRMTAGPGGRGIARARVHSPAGHSWSGGPGGPVYGWRRRRPIQRAMNSSSPAVWLRTMSSAGLSNNGTASGDSGLRTAVLRPPAVRMGITVRPVVGRARCAGSIRGIPRPQVSASHGRCQRYTAVTRQYLRFCRAAAASTPSTVGRARLGRETAIATGTPSWGRL